MNKTATTLLYAAPFVVWALVAIPVAFLVRAGFSTEGAWPSPVMGVVIGACWALTLVSLIFKSATIHRTVRRQRAVEETQ